MYQRSQQIQTLTHNEISKGVATEVFGGSGSRFLLLVGLIVVLSFIAPNFLSLNNFINVFRQASLLLIMSIGMTLVILTGRGGIDLSIGSVLALSSCMAASALKAGLPVTVSIIIGLSIGALCGLVNGALVTMVGLPAFIATFGMMQIARGAVLLYMKGAIIYGFSPAFRFIGAGHLFGLPMPVIVAGVLFAVFTFVLYRTPFGKEVYAIGANRIAAELSGVRVNRVLLTVYTISGAMAACAGLVYISRLNAAESVIGQLFELQAIAATVIGGTSFRGGEGGLIGTIAGALIITFLNNGMNLLGISSLWQLFVLGSVIVSGVTFDMYFWHRSR
ncbi:MAG TPA: ABC transporter permease [Firmicutes bacterium]|nr:ABC transporter permease [Bacillota bacterium]